MRMVRPSNPRLMACVLDAVVNLGDTRGSSAREVLSFIRQSNVSSRNLTVQIQRALKHAVNAGLLRHRSGRYKVLATLNPATAPAPPAKEPANNDQKNEEKKSKVDVRAPIGDTESSRRAQDRKKRSGSRRRSNRRPGSNTRRKSRRSPYTRRANTTVQNRKRRQRKRTYEDEELEDQSSERYVLHGRDESSVPFDRGTKRSRVSKRELQSDPSDESDRESDANRKRVSRASASSRREPKRKEAPRARSRGRSASRARSPQLQRMQARQHPVEEIVSDRRQCDEEQDVDEQTERDAARQKTREDVEETSGPNDSNSGSTIEENS